MKEIESFTPTWNLLPAQWAVDRYERLKAAKTLKVIYHRSQPI